MRDSIKRIILDLKDIDKDPIPNIYYFPDEDNIMKGKALIIGPENTPYQYGYYMFDFEFTKNYPYQPPRVTFLTYDGKTRFNPNLYKSGKVCLSILNTWSGEQWSSCQSLRSVLITLQITLNETPLLNEPGFSNKKHSEEIKLYNTIIHYQNLYHCIFYYLDNPSEIQMGKFNKEVYEIMIEQFSKNKDKIFEIINKNINVPVESLYFSFFRIEAFINYPKLMKMYEKNKNKIETK